jgi:hypothetical protein
VAAQWNGRSELRSARGAQGRAADEVRLLLNALAYNLVHATRALLEDSTGEGWSLLRVRQRVLKVAARLLVHSRQVILVLGQQAASYGRLSGTPCSRSTWPTSRSSAPPHSSPRRSLRCLTSGCAGLLLPGGLGSALCTYPCAPHWLNSDSARTPPLFVNSPG